MLARWGRFVHGHRFLTLGLSALVLAVSVYFILHAGKLKDPESLNLESGHASSLLGKELPKTGGSSFLLVFGSDRLHTDDPAFRDAMTAALAPLSGDSRVKQVITPYSGDPQSPAQVSTDHTTALATVFLYADQADARRFYPHLRDMVHSDRLHVLATGNVATGSAFDSYLAADLSRAEVISLPATVILLLLVFGALVAAGLPLGVGIVSILGGLGGIGILAHFTDVSSYAQNVVTLIGLGVSIDYSLFIVNRFREELAGGATREDALSTAMGTAGRAIAFSGVTVAIGLSGMLFYQGSFLPSMGLAGGIVVALAVFYSLTLLPALLALLGPNVNRVRLPISVTGSKNSWHRLAMAVMRRPVWVLVPTVGFIVLAGVPFTHLRMANGDISELPARAEVVHANDLVKQKFPARNQTTISVVAEFPGSPLTTDRVGAIYDAGQRYAKIPGVVGVTSIASLDPSISRATYQRMYSGPPAALPAPAAETVRLTTGKDLALLSVMTNQPPESDASRDVLRRLRADRSIGDGHAEVTGQTAFDVDIVNYIIDRTPMAVGFIVVVTAVVLFLLLGSVLLPLKAVVMNFLSLSASFGALVWLFQDGHLSSVLHFTPQSIDPSIPVLLFCIVFGLSMDYEVLLMSRMKEEWEHSHDNRHAVAQGLELSGRLVTGAAAIMFVVFLGFGLADVVLIKSIGLGMAIAVAIDATLVRALIVPATMRLLGNLNWWAPGPLARLYQRLGLGETSSHPAAEAA